MYCIWIYQKIINNYTNLNLDSRKIYKNEKGSKNKIKWGTKLCVFLLIKILMCKKGWSNNPNEQILQNQSNCEFHMLKLYCQMKVCYTILKCV